ncbi:NAD(P)/FAD-dependent oxidoreductase [Peptacetobacter sp.]|uniref:NAD(P)/FAD-dependent oxidoreductase n=1 Tax=Peptacetobacter sp. TaxID=2991975 RepID=UPI0026037251|nr:NAD(P)/FAD-dependent oxidoreductase [Peptacetobacter sp.]
MRYDIAIIGSGPAALSAAINAKIRNKNIIIFGSKNLSNKLIKAPVVDNYLGLAHITGKDLMQSFKEHIEKMGLEIVNKKINNIYSMGDYFALMSGQEMFEATTVILGTGVEFTRAMVGEEEFLGKGVGYCATCDAPLYKGKKVAIIGHTPDAEEEANYINEIAEKTYYIPLYNLKNSSEIDGLDKNIEIISSRPTKIEGNEQHVNKLVFKEESIDIDGVFILKDSVSPKELVPGLDTEGAHIKVNRDMSTNILGCFAAGDCTGKPYQFMKAAGEGQVAGLSAVSYLDKIKKNN